MNYYKQGDAANAQQIKAAFEAKGYCISWPGGCANSDVINIGVERNGAKYVVAETSEYIKDIIKTHPDYQELELPVAKFKAGDWLVYEDGNTFAGGSKSVQVKAVEGDRYIFTHNTNGSCSFIDRNCRLWTIQDANDGDVLATDNGWTCIFKAFDGYVFSSYCFMDSQKWVCEVGAEGHTRDSRINGNIHPATKEQRTLFFKKVQEAGYQWYAGKKELKKIQPHYDISNFKPFNKVLVRCDNDEEWKIEFFCTYDTLVHTAPHRNYPFMGIGDSYSQCIPYDGNKHLLGTTDMCDEQYINW